MMASQDPRVVLIGSFVALGGSLLLIIGLGFYAKAKGRHPAWGLMGLLSLIGVLVLACLTDRTDDYSIRDYRDSVR